MPPGRYIEDGDPRSLLWLVGEAPGEREVEQGKPFRGASGMELDQLLREAGLDRRDVFLTNVCHERPPTYINKHGKAIANDIEQFFATATEAKRANMHAVRDRFPREPIRAGLSHLRGLLEEHTPTLVVGLGNTPLWALTGETGITKWRGSLLHGSTLGSDRTVPVLGTFHPADIIPNRNPHHRPILLHDLERAARILRDGAPSPPRWDFTIPTTPREVQAWLSGLDTDAPLACDIETRAGQIACLGFASSASRAMCIPFMRATSDERSHSYWDIGDEVEITSLLCSKLRQHLLTFHNGLYDIQYMARQWGLLPRYADDTMVMQHVAFPGFLGGKIDPIDGTVDKRGSSLSLSFIASMYCHHYSFWKDDGRLFDPSIHDERQLWRYNCEDCCRTWECQGVLQRILQRDGLWEQYRFEMDLMPVTFDMMFRGLRVDLLRMRQQREQIVHGMTQAKAWIDEATGCDFMPKSAPQCMALFYTDLGLPVRRNKHTKAPTLDDSTLTDIARKTPHLRPLVEQIQHYRTLDTIKDDVDVARVSHDGRLRTALNPDYVETFRYSSNDTAFPHRFDDKGRWHGEGGNLQNIPRSPED